MNGPVYPPLADTTFLFLTGTFAVGVILLSLLTTEDQTRGILGRRLDRYGAISDDELSPALEWAGKTRFYSIAGLVAVLACALVWRLMLYYGVHAERFLRAQDGRNGSHWWSPRFPDARCRSCSCGPRAG